MRTSAPRSSAWPRRRRSRTRSSCRPGPRAGSSASNLPDPADREAYQGEVRACYQTFIRAMLDVTDNLVAGEVVPPPGVVRHDGDDPYLVVAADKGTATFSDTANEISKAYGLLAGRRVRLRRLGGLRPQEDGHHRPRRLGVGQVPLRDAGHRRRRRRLHRGRDRRHVRRRVRQRHAALAAHQAGGRLRPPARLPRPDPDPATSFAERQRLFALPRSSWADYNTDADLARRRGVAADSASRCRCPRRRALPWASTTTSPALAPDQLISAILAAPVDLLWNGGIGTYVKASTESHADAGDRANDAVRIDAPRLRAQVVGEGGNLGLTQAARIEYALAGGWSTPTSSTTPPGWTPPTTRSTSRSCCRRASPRVS